MKTPFDGLGVMPSNSSSLQTGYIAGKYPNRIGWLISPGGFRKPPTWMPYALDNGAYGSWANKTEWDQHAFIALLEKAAMHKRPLWVVVPDVVTDKEATIEKWAEWTPIILDILPHVNLAFAVQDGMTKADVPSNADVVFVGGSFEWKWRTARMWSENFPRVHIARVNTEKRLWMCYDMKVESCDGTGWLQGGEARTEELERFLELSTRNDKRPQMIMETILQ